MGKRKKIVWSEPQLPPFVKINPESPPGLGEGLQPGRKIASSTAAQAAWLPRAKAPIL